MDAIEFVTDTKNGIIRIPRKYNTFNSKHVRVIPLTEEKVNRKESIVMKNKKFNPQDFFGIVNYSNSEMDDFKNLNLSLLKLRTS